MPRRSGSRTFRPLVHKPKGKKRPRAWHHNGNSPERKKAAKWLGRAA